MPKKNLSSEVDVDVTKAPVVEEKTTAPEPETDMMKMLQSIANSVGSLAQEVGSLKTEMDDMKNNGANKFMREAKVEDIKVASETRKHVDPKVSQIVDEMLGEDFGVTMHGLGDRPGFRFSVIVPPRLSDNVLDRRPVYERDENGVLKNTYKRDESGNVLYEDYIPEDRRSRIISSTDSYDAIKKHCERVRGYIVAYFQKTNQPLPEFKVR